MLSTAGFLYCRWRQYRRGEQKRRGVQWKLCPKNGFKRETGSFLWAGASLFGSDDFKSVVYLPASFCALLRKFSAEGFRSKRGFSEIPPKTK